MGLFCFLWSLIVIGWFAFVVSPIRKLKSAVCRGGCGMGRATSAQKQEHGGTGARVAVIGGGIAGTGAAWSIAQTMAKEAGNAGATFKSVHLYEQRPVLGGNAKTHLWQVAKDTDTGAAKVVKGTAENNTTAAADSGSNDDAIIDTVRTGLSVLAWPPSYFKNYESLLATLGIRTAKVRPKFMVATASPHSGGDATAQFRQGSPNPKWCVDMKRWDDAVAAIRFINNTCGVVDALVTATTTVAVRGVVGLLLGGGRKGVPNCEQQKGDVDEDAVAVGANKHPATAAAAPSFYEVTLWNPLNIITARFFVCRLFGVSPHFWDTVVVPIYSSSFLTTKLDALPAMILPALDDIISVGLKDPLKTLHTWSDSSNTVFEAMAKDILMAGVEGGSTTDGDANNKAKVGSANKILLGTKITAVEWSATEKQWTVTYTTTTTSGDGKGSSSSMEQRQKYDYVVFACPSEAINTFTNTPINHDSGFRGGSPSLFNAIIPQMTYENERDDNFTVGHIHCDGRALPGGTTSGTDKASPVLHASSLGAELLRDRYTNYIEVASARGSRSNGKHHRIPSAAKGKVSADSITARYGAVATTDSVENIFILSTWVPQAVAANERHFGATATTNPTADNVLKMMVTYNPSPSRKRLFADTPEGYVGRAHVVGKRGTAAITTAAGSDKHVRTEHPTKTVYTTKGANNSTTTAIDPYADKSTIALVDNTWAHPQLDMPNMLRAHALTMLQGRCNAYYCGNYATPGNGHDLSFLSGLVIADEVAMRVQQQQQGAGKQATVGSTYPFNHNGRAIAGAFDDFKRLRGLMLRSL